MKDVICKILFLCYVFLLLVFYFIQKKKYIWNTLDAILNEENKI
jgi:hypothetical protein